MNDTMKTLIRVMARLCGLQDPDVFASCGGLMSVDERLARMPSEPCPSQGGARCVDGRTQGGPGCRSNGMVCGVCHGKGRVLVGGREAYESGTGRTTRMLLEALVALKADATVEIVAMDQTHAAVLRPELLGFAWVAGVRDIADRVRFSWPGYAAYAPDELPADVRLVDHRAKAMNAPSIEAVERLLPQAAAAAVRSPCSKSKRGVVIFRAGGQIVAAGHNAQPPPFACDGSEACRAACGKLCTHAEVAALRGIGLARPSDLHMLHVKVVHGVAVPSGPPSCWQCSREILAAGIATVWLLHEDGLCMCTAEEFHAETLAHCGLPVLREGS